MLNVISIIVILNAYLETFLFKYWIIKNESTVVLPADRVMVINNMYNKN